MFSYIQAHIPLCVKIRGALVSGDRPARLPNGDDYALVYQARCPVCFREHEELGQTCPEDGCMGRIASLRYVQCQTCEREGWGHYGGLCGQQGCQGRWSAVDQVATYQGSGWIDEIKEFKFEERLCCIQCGREDIDGQSGDECGKADCSGVMVTMYPVRCNKCKFATDLGRRGDKCRLRCGGVYELVLCGCHACDQSEHKSRDFCKIGVTTANHVLFDGKEVKACEVILFDNGKGERLEILKGADIRSSDVAADYCEFDIFTHDADLIEKIGDMLATSKSRIIELQDKFNSGSDNPSLENTVNDEPVALLGYPHACQAYVCIGNLKKIEREERNEYVRYMKTKVQYEVKSCTGNSGGMVIPFKPRGEFGYKRLYVHPHYGRFEMSNTIGVSGGWCKGDK